MDRRAQKDSDIRRQMFAMLTDKAVFRQAQEYAYAYMDDLPDRAVFPSPEAIDGLSAFDEPLPEVPGDPAEILARLHGKGSPATVTHAGGRYFGFVNGGAVPVAVAAKWLSTVWDQNSALYVISPVMAKLEAVCERWLVDLLGLPKGTAAGFVTGTSIATFCGLAAGRNHLLQNAGWDVSAKGLFGAPKLRVIVGAEAHATVFKALSLLGLGAENVERVGVDAQGRMDPTRLPQLDDRCLLVLQAGNVNTGVFDPFTEICPLARQAGAWVHVDGAFGLWAAGSQAHHHLVEGVAVADSWSLDAHKTLNTPYDCGIILCRQKDKMVSAMQASASYILYSENRDNMLLTPDMSRRGRAVELWATLKFFGRQGVQDLVEGLCQNAEKLAALLKTAGFRVLNEVVFNQVLVACDNADETVRTLNQIQNSGECWCGGVMWRDTQAIRLSVCSWATTPADLERTVAAFVEAREKARRNGAVSAPTDL